MKANGQTSGQAIGFVGLGVMGRPMAGHLLSIARPLRVSTRTPASARELLESGAVWCDSPAGLASSCQVVFTMVGVPDDVEEVYFGERGLFRALTPGTLLIDMTTSRPDLAARIAREADARGAQAVDAPVSGGDKGAREATLSIMAGGSAGAFERACPLLERLGSTVVRQGPPGSGQSCKLCNQVAIASTMVGVCEALAFAERSGLDPSTALRSIALGAAGSWSMSHLAPRMLTGDFAPGFAVKHLVKDLAMAVECAETLGLDAPGLALALRMYRALAASGGADQGTQALLRLYRDQA